VALVLVLLLLVVIGVGIAIWMAARGGAATVPAQTVLEIDFNEELIEYLPDDPFAAFLDEDRMTMIEMLAAIEAAATDDRVAGIIARTSDPAVGLAHIQELRDAILAFRESGKPAVAFADTFGEFVGGNGGYYLATAFDEIYIQPSGDVGLTGFAAVHPFIRGTLEKLGVTPEFGQRYEYKNAVNLFTETEFTPAHEEAMRELLDSFYGQLVAGVAQGRGLTEEQVRELADRGPLLGEAAVEAGLVDGLKYRDQVYDDVLERAGEGAELLYVNHYADRATLPYRDGDTVALIYGIGGVTRGESDFDPLTGSLSMGGDSVAAAFRAAIDDDDVKAILFRVDSPGGSYVGSDTVWHEVAEAREAGKPVVVSMANVAGSGGYFVAMAANKIVAEPGTITGSIGVFAGKFVTREMWGKIGVTFDELATSENALMWSATHGYTEKQWSKLDESLDRVYVDFTTKVAEGRNMPVEQVQEIAKGRIWSGTDAKELGLIDELGGFKVALDLVRQEAGLEPDAPVRLQRFPPTRSAWEQLFGEGPENSRDEATRAALRRIMTAVRPLAGMAERLGLLGGDPGVLDMGPVPEVR
jgi:protease-4